MNRPCCPPSQPTVAAAERLSILGWIARHLARAAASSYLLGVNDRAAITPLHGRCPCTRLPTEERLGTYFCYLLSVTSGYRGGGLILATPSSWSERKTPLL